MRKREFHYYAADFETTVFPGQKYTEVWAAAIVPFWSKDVMVYNNIDGLFDYLKRQKSNAIVYFHNLKFDGSFILHYLEDSGYQKATTVAFGSERWKDPASMATNTYRATISAENEWYKIEVKIGTKIIEIRDSLKLIPASVSEIAASFNTSVSKLEIEYTGMRFAGGKITDEEKDYIKNDVLIIKEALEKFIRDGYDKMTIGSNCMDMFRSLYDTRSYHIYFPEIYNMTLPRGFSADNAGQWIRRSFRGGWNYLKPEYAGKTIGPGITIDVNSLYPYVMHSNSGCEYPVGYPHFWRGNYIPKESKGKYVIIRFRCSFDLKPGMLPFVTIKGNPLYKSTEIRTSSKISIKGRVIDHYTDFDGKRKKLIPEITLPLEEFRLMQRHYDIYDLEILEGCWFNTEKNLFDKYINHWYEIKTESSGAQRAISKLFLNNLSGRFAMQKHGELRQPVIENHILRYSPITDDGLTPGYIPIGTAITSRARIITIQAAQDNIDRFVYSDTDSLHCLGTAEELTNIKIHKTALGQWKIETVWDKARFIRQKTYIECSSSSTVIRAAGLPERGARILKAAITQDPEDIRSARPQTQDEIDYIESGKTLEDFKDGLQVPGVLKARQIPGGVVLTTKAFKLGAPVRTWH